MMTLKKLVPILALVIAVSASAACAGTLFKSEAFSMKIMSGWDMNKSDNLLSLTGPDGATSLLVTSDDAEDVDFDTFEAAFLKGMEKTEKDYKLVSSERVKIDGATAAVWTFTSSLESGLKIKNRIYSTIKDDVAYNVILVCLLEQFDDDVVDLEVMIDSWTWL